MSESELAEIEARANAATPGPWERDADLQYPTVRVAYDTRPPARYRIASIGAVGRTNDAADVANAAFIASARSDVPTLVAEVKRLDERLGELQLAHADCLGIAEDTLSAWRESEMPSTAAEAVRQMRLRFEATLSAADGEIRRLQALLEFAACDMCRAPLRDYNVEHAPTCPNARP